jgi:hypothetical protein
MQTQKVTRRIELRGDCVACQARKPRSFAGIFDDPVGPIDSGVTASRQIDIDGVTIAAYRQGGQSHGSAATGRNLTVNALAT